jgi:hypothetical protein
MLDPAGKVVVSVSSSSAIGRLIPRGRRGLVRYIPGHAAASARKLVETGWRKR